MSEAMMTDDELDNMIADPSLIQTHDQALEIIDALDVEIAGIQAQVDAAQIEAGARPLSEDRQGWLRRASYAAAMKRNERHRVMQRDKELRGIKLWGGKPADPDKKEANIIKQKRLAGEVEIRRLAKQSEHTRLENERMALAQQRREFQALRDAQFEKRFVEAARRTLLPDQFEFIRAIAKDSP